MVTARKFASSTIISVSSTLEDIEQILRRYGASGFLQHKNYDQGYFVLAFQTKIGSFMLHIPLPDPEEFSPDKPAVRINNATEKNAFKNRYDQEFARIMRAVFNLIKMKLVAIDEGITTLEKEFFGDLVVFTEEGKQQTVYEWYAPQVEHLRKERLMPPLLPAVERPRLIPGVVRQIEGK